MFRSHKKEWKGENEQHKLVDPENASLHQIYSFSANPIDQPLYDSPEVNPFRDWWHGQVAFFKSLKFCYVKLYCEYSPKGRWHFHGFLRLADRLKFYVFDVPKIKLFYSVEMDQFGNNYTNYTDNVANWQAYCLKLQSDVQPYLQSELFPLTKKFTDNQLESYIVIDTY